MHRLLLDQKGNRIRAVNSTDSFNDLKKKKKLKRSAFNNASNQVKLIFVVSKSKQFSKSINEDMIQLS